MGVAHVRQGWRGGSICKMPDCHMQCLNSNMGNIGCLALRDSKSRGGSETEKNNRISKQICLGDVRDSGWRLRRRAPAPKVPQHMTLCPRACGIPKHASSVCRQFIRGLLPIACICDDLFQHQGGTLAPSQLHGVVRWARTRQPSPLSRVSKTIECRSVLHVLQAPRHFYSGDGVRVEGLASGRGGYSSKMTYQASSFQ